MYVESSYKQLLFGVSQQDYKDRLDGQNEEQVNMTSDLTFNLRRRAPVQLVGDTGISATPDNLAVYNTTVAGQEIILYVDEGTGNVFLQDETGVPVLIGQDNYLI